MAIPLIPYLSGTYEGFDTIKPAIDWCREHITAAHPNFGFRHTDIYNKTYNPGGRVKSAEFAFPYPDASFDFVFATSVFTHMFPADIEHYCAEVSRVLAPGGTLFSTWFLINPESTALIASGKSSLPMTHRLNDCFTASRRTPENAIGIEESRAASILGGCGLTRVQIHKGSWCGREQGTSYQDIVVASSDCRYGG
jgi:SAM-dependent methyltransferase